ncbi:hypothetical protein NFG81_18765 [Bacillus paralicheniformis]|uniref:hypothetical protein n=1 Tax=Bacillus TaxID=1386 RepID=UPI00057C1B6A|nr:MULTISPECIES: hypothetical protein [Bacillus]MCQ5457356.1 hypothetical protein [Bacillus paralicheniformis]MDE1383631.1 hypothetical protein [Bacillus paralicheniformis]
MKGKIYQILIENAERWGMLFFDHEGGEKFLEILHYFEGQGRVRMEWRKFRSQQKTRGWRNESSF